MGGVFQYLGVVISLVAITSCQEPWKSLQVEPCKDKIIPEHEPMFYRQWYLSGDGGIDINILPVWQKCYGTKPISVGIIDNAVDVNHPDLRGSMLEKGTGDYKTENHHGTAVAGLLAARDNGAGIIGVSPRAKVYSYPLPDPATGKDVEKVFTDIADAADTTYSAVAVYNVSFGVMSQVYNRPIPSPERNAFDEITQKGFHGKGANLVFAAGNSNVMLGWTQSSSNDPLLNHYSVIAVNALNKTGKLGRYSKYMSITGVNIWVTAPSDIKSSDMISTYNDGTYGNLGQTSAAAPLVSGAIALLRSEYPHLTWRDVKLILAESAKKHDYEGKAKYKASGVKYSDGSEQQYSYRMGFGLLDVANAFELAEGWKLLPDMKVHTYPQETPFTMPKTNTYTSTVSVDAAISFIESVTLEMNMEATDQTKGIKFHTLKLIAPDGKTSIIYEPVGFKCSYLDAEKCFFPNEQKTLVFVVNSFLGSSASGDWKLEIQQFDDHTIEKVSSWKLTFRGH